MQGPTFGAGCWFTGGMSLEHPLVCPHRVRFEVMRMWWRNLAFIHWPVEPADVQKQLPEGLHVDTFDGAAWVALVPFEMEVQLPGGIPIPREGRFPETNIRTYVKGPDGTPGVWFDSLEAGRLSATAMARATYGLPYFWATMTAERNGSNWEYESVRRWPKPAGVHSKTIVRPGEHIATDDQTAFEHFLTARWGLFSTFHNHVLYAPISHGVWPLQRAELLHLDDGLAAAAGYTIPDIEPVVHWTAGTEVRIGPPRRVKV